jgi:hypothetical protein
MLLAEGYQMSFSADMCRYSKARVVTEGLQQLGRGESGQPDSRDDCVVDHASDLVALRRIEHSYREPLNAERHAKHPLDGEAAAVQSGGEAAAATMGLA